MNWLWLVSYFFGGAFAANAIPHFVSGTMDVRFKAPLQNHPARGSPLQWSMLSGDSSTRWLGIFWSRTSVLSIRGRQATSSRSAWARCSSASFLRVTSASSMGATHRRAHEEPDVRHLPLHFRSLTSFNFRLWTAGGLVSKSVPGCSASLRIGSC